MDTMGIYSKYHMQIRLHVRIVEHMHECLAAGDLFSNLPILF